ncbi:MAG: hypothetical protein JTT14_01385, partial [Candidatus Brockarchaeota archaeon]|nr:hypothetical protein [Candidatus Brockarchaeota archaeon]
MSIKAEYFPYKFKYDQERFFHFLQKEVIEKNVVISAPTGYGKTPLILAALLPIAKKEKRKIIWAVRTGTETDRPIEELKIISKNYFVTGISFRGKKDMCLLQRTINEEMDYEDVTYFCKTKIKNGECKFYTNLNSVIPIHARVPLTYSEVLSWCEKNEICPYYYQLELIKDVDVIAVNYNYVLNEPISWVIKSKIRTENAFLVVDEAHNLQNAYSNINTSKITINTINNAIKEIEENFGERIECSKFLTSIKLYFEEILEEIKKENVEDKVVRIDEILNKCGRSYEEFEEEIEEVEALGNKLREKKVREGKAPRSSLHALGNFFTKALELTLEEGVELIANLENKDNLSLEIFDMRSGELLSEVWDKYYRTIFCSGTLGPPKAFAETIGLKSFVYGEFNFKLRKENCISLVTLELSSEGEELPKDMTKKYIEAIESLILGLNENIAIFSASYRIQQDLINNGLLQMLERNNRSVFIEEKGMSGDKSRAIIESFKKSSEEKRKGVLIATAGGRFSEGADFPGK